MQTTAGAELSVACKDEDGTTLAGPAAIVLCQALGHAGVTTFVSPDPDVYTSLKGGCDGDAAAYFPE